MRWLRGWGGKGGGGQAGGCSALEGSAVAASLLKEMRRLGAGPRCEQAAGVGGQAGRQEERQGGRQADRPPTELGHTPAIAAAARPHGGRPTPHAPLPVGQLPRTTHPPTHPPTHLHISHLRLHRQWQMPRRPSHLLPLPCPRRRGCLRGCLSGGRLCHRGLGRRAQRLLYQLQSLRGLGGQVDGCCCCC